MQNLYISAFTRFTIILSPEMPTAIQPSLLPVNVNDIVSLSGTSTTIVISQSFTLLQSAGWLKQDTPFAS